jgi:hypothetical protein
LWQLGESGFNGHWFYNVFRVSYTDPEGPVATTLQELYAVYSKVWRWLIGRVKLPSNTYGTELWLSAITGWDNVPAGGSQVIGRDDLALLEAHVKEMLDIGEAEPLVAGYIIDAWNEHLEGSAIEPITRLGRAVLGIFRRYRV